MKRHKPLLPKRTGADGKPRFSTFAAPSAPTLRRTRMATKRRRPKPGDEPLYKAWAKTQPCVVCGSAEVDPHHMINGKGADRKGMGQTAPDRLLLPACRRHHDEFHHRRGFCASWDDAQRLTFQEQEIERLRAIWDDLHLLGILQEPERKAI